jgi:hypothetical protein
MKKARWIPDDLREEMTAKKNECSNTKIEYTRGELKFILKLLLEVRVNQQLGGA